MTKQKSKNRRGYGLLFAAVLMLCLWIGSGAQALKVIDETTRYGNHGTAKSLNGTSVVVSVFADEPTYKWDMSKNTDLQRYSRSYYSLKAATEWLTQQAANYGVETKFVWDWMDTNSLYKRTAFNQNMVTYENADYNTYWYYINNNLDPTSIQQETNAENILYVFNYNTPESNQVGSYAWPFGQLADNQDGEELVVMFTGLFNGLATPGTYAHEILHLYGVPDMYRANAAYGMSETFIEYYKKLYPRDVMAGGATTDPEQVDFIMSPLTAYYAGLTTESEMARQWGLRVSEYEQLGYPTEADYMDKVGSFVERCYSLFFHRTADDMEVLGWTDLLKSGGMTASQVVSGFSRSAEYLNQNPSNADTVEVLYQTMMDRASDPAGKAAWTSYLDNGCSDSTVINGFCNSAEFTKICEDYGITAGSVRPETRDVNPSVTAFVNRCYKESLGRNGEAGGLNSWCEVLLTKAMTPQEVARGFIFSQEMASRQLSNVEMVWTLYRLYMDRDPQNGEEWGWVNLLNSGTELEYVNNGFAQSAEFAAIVAEYGL